MPQCCFAGCHNRTDDGRGLSFFRFPRRDLARTAAWVIACGRKDFSPSQHSRVCSRHFSAMDFDRDARHDSQGGVHRRLRLKDTAVPTTNPIDNPWQNTDNIVSRKSQKSVSATSMKTNMVEVSVSILKESLEEKNTMCTPAKRIATVDALDLSHKPTLDMVAGSDVIVLSEDDDEKATPLGSDTEKENSPFGKNASDVKSLLISLENELRQEEAALLLLQKLRESQNPNSAVSSRSASKSALHSSHSLYSNVSASGQRTTSALSSSQRAAQPSQQPKTITQAVPQSSSPIPAPKVTKQAALQSLEQLYATKKAVLRKQLERNLEKVSLPTPTTGTGFCEVAFIPSTITAEFTSLLGLEEVVRTIQDFDPSNLGKPSEPRCTFSPFSCVKCGTDFTPVWKREKAGSTNVVCEACLTGTQRLTLKREYEEAVQQVLQLHVSSEREIEREYQDIINTPSKLDSYIKEQEKKLLVTHQAQQQQLAQQQAAYSQRYNSKASVNTTTAGLRQSPSTVVGGTSVAAAAHQRSRFAATANSSSTSVAPSPTVANSSAQAAAQAAAAAQIALQQYAKAISSASTTSATSPTATAALMMAAVANNQQQQQAAAAAAALQQQRLAAAQLLSGLQAQQQQQAVAAASSTPTTSDHAANALNQIQTLLMSTALIGGAGGGAGNQSANSRQQLLQQAMQYLLLQQQQQQAQQQAAAAQAAAAQAAQQNAVITHFLSQIQSNPTAYFNLMQLWAASGLGGAAGNGGVPGKK